MPTIQLSVVYRFVRNYYPPPANPTDPAPVDSQRAEYTSDEKSFDTATLSVLTGTGPGADISVEYDPAPVDFYLSPGEIHSYCTGMDRRPWLCDGQGAAYAGTVEVNAAVCGAVAPVPGCTNPQALNYDALATVDNGSCVLPVPSTAGCTNPRARNYNAAATVDNGTCQFGPVGTVAYDYSSSASAVVVFNEALDLFVTEQTYRPQMLLPIEGKGLFTLPLPNQSGDAPMQRYLWEHNAAPFTTFPKGGVQLYGRPHLVWVEVVVLGSGVNTVKTVDNFVLVSNEVMPHTLVVTAPEQGFFTQQFIQLGNPLSDTCRRQEQLTYGVVVPPQSKPWGGRVRAKWARLRFLFHGNSQVRLSNLLVLLRESVS